MSLLLKDPLAVLDYSIDWRREYLADDALVDSAWSVTPTEEGGVGVLATFFDSGSATAKVVGGLPGHIYRLTNMVVTAAGREDRRTVTLRVEAR